MTDQVVISGMGRVEHVNPARLVCGILSQHGEVGSEAESVLERRFGPIDLRSLRRPFTESVYYEPEMGPELDRWWVSFERLVTEGEIASIKRVTNAMERDLADDDGRRRVNLDPGYLVPSRLVLATTKDFAHRIYLADGIYGEVTLTWRHDTFMPMEWTYPDYRSEDATEFFVAARKRLMDWIHTERMKDSRS